MFHKPTKEEIDARVKDLLKEFPQMNTPHNRKLIINLIVDRVDAAKRLADLCLQLGIIDKVARDEG